MIIGSEDTQMHAKIQRRIERYSRYEKFKDHINNQNMEAVNDFEEISDQEASEIPDLEDKDLNSSNSDMVEEDEPPNKKKRSLSDLPETLSNVNVEAKTRHRSATGAMLVHKEITREGLIAATTAVSIRTGISYRDQTQFLSAIVNYLDGDVE